MAKFKANFEMYDQGLIGELYHPSIDSDRDKYLGWHFQINNSKMPEFGTVQVMIRKTSSCFKDISRLCFVIEYKDKVKPIYMMEEFVDSRTRISSDDIRIEELFMILDEVDESAFDYKGTRISGLKDNLVELEILTVNDSRRERASVDEVTVKLHYERL